MRVKLGGSQLIEEPRLERFIGRILLMCALQLNNLLNDLAGVMLVFDGITCTLRLLLSHTSRIDEKGFPARIRRDNKIV